MRGFVLLAAVAITGCGSGDPCNDGERDGHETDIDCGGDVCAACNNDAVCAQDADCHSAYCAADSTCQLPPTMVPSAAGAHTFSIDSGASIVISPGTQAGYGITATAGGSYRIVWTGDGAASGSYHEFSGTIWTAGTFLTVNPGAGGIAPLEAGDVVLPALAVAGGERIDFDTFASDGLDGIDFSVSEEPAYFQLLIDGQARPSLIFFSSGGIGAIPDTDPFGLIAQ